jgi:hypothetical protein
MFELRGSQEVCLLDAAGIGLLMRSLVEQLAKNSMLRRTALGAETDMVKSVQSKSNGAVAMPPETAEAFETDGRQRASKKQEHFGRGGAQSCVGAEFSRVLESVVGSTRS